LTTALAEHGLQGGVGPLASTDLTLLRDRYEEGPRTFVWPAPTVHRFSGTDGRVRILSWDDPQGQAYWFLWAETPDALQQLAEDVWTCGTAATTLQAIESECGALVLDKLGRSDAWDYCGQWSEPVVVGAYEPRDDVTPEL